MAPRDEVAELKEQIVTLRLRIDHQGEAMAALVDHMVRREIAAQMGDRLPTEEVTRWATEQAQSWKDRRKALKDVVLHTVKFGTLATIGFLCYAAWEEFKTRVTGVK